MAQEAARPEPEFVPITIALSTVTQITGKLRMKHASDGTGFEVEAVGYYLWMFCGELEVTQAWMDALSRLRGLL
jgi:hypothetical protein